MRKALLTTVLVCSALIGNAEHCTLSYAPAPVHSIGMNDVSNFAKFRAPMKASSTSIDFGYGQEGDDCDILGVGAACTYRPLIHFTPELATKYAGNKVTGLKFYVGGVSNTQVTALLVEKMDGGTFLASQTGVVTPGAWNTIKFDTPYTIEAGKEFYFGYDAQGGADDYTIGIYASTTNATPDNSIAGCYVEGEGWEFFYGDKSLASLGYSHCAILATIEGESLPQNDIAISTANALDVYEFGEDVSVDVSVANMASNDVTSFDFAYSINGGAEVVESVTDASIAVGSGANYTLTLPISEKGLYDLKLRVLNPNGVDDTDPSNNSWSASFEVSSTFPRTTLVENFTTTMCQNCPDAHKRLHDAVDGADDLILVAHHSGFYTTTDKMNNAMHDAYLKFFGTNGSYAPAMMVNRTNIDPIFGTGDEGPATYVYNEPYLTMILDELKSYPTKYQVSVVPTYNIETRELKVDVLAQVGGVETDTYVNVFVVEDGIVAPQTTGPASSIQKYVHNGVTRVNLAGNWGEKLTWTNGEASKSYTYTIPADYKDYNVSVVAFVSHYNSKDINDCKVYNAAKAEISELAGVSSVVSSPASVVMGGNGEVVVAGNASNVAVYGVDGSLKAQAQGAGTISLAPGLYIVKAGDTVKKVLVK